MSVHFCKQCGKKSYLVLTYQGLSCAYCSPLPGDTKAETKRQSNLLTGVVNSLNSFLDLLEDKTKDKCPKCGHSWEDFVSTARLGCAYDYEYFYERLKPILYKIHGSDKHKIQIK